MAGIFSPQLSEASGAGSLGRPFVDESAGNAMASAGRLLQGVASIASDGSDEQTLTQTDRDRAALRPFVVKMEKLEQQWKSGNISSSVYSAKRNHLFNSAITVLPDNVSDIRNAFGSITGDDFSQESPDPEAEFDAMIMNWATDPDNPAGNLAFLEAYTTDKSGGVDRDATFAALRESFYRERADQAQLLKLRQRKESLALSGEVAELAQDNSTDEFIARGSKKVREGLSGMIDAYPAVFPQHSGSGQSVSVFDREKAISGLTQLRAAYADKFHAEATTAGILDNIQNKYDDGIATMLRPIDNAIAVLTRMTKEQEDTLKGMDTQATLTYMQLLKQAGVVVTESQLNSDFVTNSLLAPLSGEVQEVGRRAAKVMQTLVPTELDRTIPLDERVGLNGQPSEALSQSVSNLSVDDARTQAKKSIGIFKNITMMPELTDRVVEQAVGSMVSALEVLNQAGAPMSFDSFNQVFDKEFFEAYTAVDLKGGRSVTDLNENLSGYLTRLLVERETAADVALQGVDFSGTFSDFSVEFNGSRYSVESTGVVTDYGQQVNRALKKKGLPRTFEGLKSLISEDYDNAVVLGVTTFVKTMEEQLKYLNKITDTVDRLPDEVSDTVLQRNEELPQETPQTAQQDSELPTISSMEELDSLEDGQSYLLVLPDGSTMQFTRGQERSQYEEMGAR